MCQFATGWIGWITWPEDIAIINIIIVTIIASFIIILIKSMWIGGDVPVWNWLEGLLGQKNSAP